MPRDLFEGPDQERMEAENEIRLFLRLFPLFAAHFELKTGVDPLSLFRDMHYILAERYERAHREERQGDKDFVASLPSVPEVPDIKRPILESDED